MPPLTINGKPALPVKFWLRALSWPAAMLVILAHVLWRDIAFTWQAALCCGSLAALALLAVAYTEPRTLPALALVLTHFYFAMGFPVFSQPFLEGIAGPFRISSRALDEAALAGLIFAAVVLLAAVPMRAVGRRIGPSVTRIFKAPGSYRAADTAAVRCLAAVAIALYTVMALSGKGQTVLGPFGYPATLVSGPAVPLTLLYWDLHERPSFAARVWFWGTAGTLAMVGLGTGMLGAAFLPCMAAILLGWTVSGRAHVLLVLVAVIGLIALNSAKHTYRALAWRNEVSVVDRAQHWGTAIDKTYSANQTAVLDQSSRSASARLATLPAVAHMFDWVPLKIPHAGPEQWIKTPLEYIPRALWKDKPQHTLEYNRRYTLLFGLQSNRYRGATSLTLPSVGEGYWRLGWLGVLLEAFFLGGLVGIYEGMQRTFARPTTLLGLCFAVTTQPDQHIFQAISGQPQFVIGMMTVLFMAHWLPAVFMGRGSKAIFFDQGGPPTARLRGVQ